MWIYDKLIQHFTDHGLYIVPNIIERFASSLGGHVLNLANVDHRLYSSYGLPTNFRSHIVYIAPSGWTKSTYFRILLKDRDGIVWNNDKVFPTDLHSSFSPASWFGTIKEAKDNEVEQRDGIFHRYKRGIVGADDYQALTLLFDGQGIGEDERALMTALDTDEAVKNLSLGQIRIRNVGVTMWFGIRPSRVNLTSGLARRFQFPRFYPTRVEAEIFRRMAREQMEMNMEVEGLETEKLPMLDTFLETYNHIVNQGIVDIDYQTVNEWLANYRLPHFEENVYRNMAIGYSVASGTYPKVEIEGELEQMLKDEIVSRESLRTDPYRLMFYNIIRAEDDESIKYKDLMYHMTMFLQFDEESAKQLIRKEKREGRIVMKGTKKSLNRATFELDWEPMYIEDLRC